NRSLAALGLLGIPDDAYWRVVAYEGAGAARAARFAACALIRPDLVDEDVLVALLEPWRTAFPNQVRACRIFASQTCRLLARIGATTSSGAASWEATMGTQTSTS